MKWILRIVVIVIVLVICAAVGAWLYLDWIAQRAVERAAGHATGQPTEVDSAVVRPFGGSLTLNGLSIANPEGFQADRFLRLGRGTVRVQPRSLLRQHVVIPQLNLNDLEVNLERTAKGANYQVILDRLKELAGPSGQEPPEQGGKTYTIERVLIRDGAVHARLDVPMSDAVNLDLPVKRLQLTDIGTGEDGGVNLAKVSGAILQAVLSGVIDQVGTQLPGQIRTTLRSNLANIENLAGEARKQIDQQMKRNLPEGSGQAADKITEGVGDLLKGKKKKNPAP